jgi:hypothetical protein
VPGRGEVAPVDRLGNNRRRVEMYLDEAEVTYRPDRSAEICGHSQHRTVARQDLPDEVRDAAMTRAHREVLQQQCADPPVMCGVVDEYRELGDATLR